MTKTPTPASHAVNTAPISADLRGMEHVEEPDFDLSTAAGGRGYVAWYFANVVKRHDFTRYLNDRLAYDFACALASHLQALRASAVQQDARPAQPSRECLQQSAAKLILQKVETLIASVNDAHLAKREDWKQACFDAADSAYADIKGQLAALQSAPPAPAGVAVPSEDMREKVTLALGLSPTPKGGPSFAWSYLLDSIRDLVKCEEELVLLKAGQEMSKARAALAAAPAPASDTESVLIDGIAYEVPAAVAGELLSLHLDLLAAAPAQAVAVPAPEWDGKLPLRLQSALNALRLECPPAVVADVEHEVRSYYQAMHISLAVARRMYGAARDRLEALDAAQPDPFVAPAQEHATQLAGQGQEARPGFALVPLRLTRAMEEVLQEEDWQWADLLAAAEALSEEDHDALSRDDLTDAEVFAVADPLFAYQQIGGKVPSQDLDGFRELIGSALSDAVFQAAAPAPAQEDAPALEAPAAPEWALFSARVAELAMEYGNARTQAALMGARTCRRKPDAVLAELNSMLAAAPQAPAAPDCLTCNDHGAVGNVLTAEPCPDCTPAPAAPAIQDEAMQALSDLTNALRERHHGRMPEEVQRAYDKAWTIVFAGPQSAAPAAPAVDARDGEAIDTLARALEMFVGSNPLHSLCVHEGMDAMGRVKGTWSAAAEANARASLKLCTPAIDAARAAQGGA